MKLKEKILEKLTLAFLRMGDAQLKKRMNYSYGEYSKAVFIFCSKSKRGAQATPWGTIIMHDIIFEEYSKNVRDLFFLHEYGHTILNFIFKTIFYISIIPLLMFFIASLISLIIMPIILLLRGTEPFVVSFVFISNLLLTGVTGLMVMTLSWASEIRAEIFAIKTMGKKKYLEAIEELRKKKEKQNLLSRAFSRLRYPPHRIIMFFYERSK